MDTEDLTDEVNNQYEKNKAVNSNEGGNSHSLSNQTTRKIEFDRGIPLSFDFVKNDVHTMDLSIHIILREILWKIMKSPLQIFIIVLAIYLLICVSFFKTELVRIHIYVIILPQVALLILQICYDLIGYIMIYLNDRRTNSQQTNIYDFEQKCFVGSVWSEIRVGHIVKVNKEEIVPADIVIIETLDSNHYCYIDESSITGVFDAFKIKRSCLDTQTPTMKPIKINEYIKNIKGMIKYEEPNAELNYFAGRLKLESFPRASDISIENFIMRGSSVKNVKCVYGIVVYTGMETKIMQVIKSQKGDVNFIKQDRNLINHSYKTYQYAFIAIYLIILLNQIVGLMARGYRFEGNIKKFYYLEVEDWFDEYYITFTIFALYVQLFIPFVWFNLIYLAYFILSSFITWDIKVIKKSQNSVDIINNNCLGDFGQVKYILSDKTGTLTNRKFNLKACLIEKKYYSFDSLDKKDDNYIFRSEQSDWIQNLPIAKDLAKERENGPIHNFLEYLCICHSVKIRKRDNIFLSNDKSFGASYAEEKAVLRVLKNLGYSLVKTKNDKFILEINGVTKIYYIVGKNRYSEERERMSIIVKKRKTDNDSLLLCKGNNANLIHYLALNSDDEKQQILDQIKRISNLGYRYFIICKKFLFEDDTNAFITKYKSAENNLIQRETLFENLANEYENEMDLLGILFFEENFSNELRYSVNKLEQAGINTWIVSGDRRDNVVSLAKNLEMVSPSSNIVEFTREDHLDDLDIKMNMHLLQFIGSSDNDNLLQSSSNEQHGISFSQQKKIQTKDLHMLLDGECFNLICGDNRLYQSLIILLGHTKQFMGYSFSPINKYKLTKIMQDYIVHNSKLLAIGDGLNDLMMLKEANLSIGIRSKEILQIRNTCDIIVTKFPQIVDLILVHGTWNLYRLISICSFSTYACTFIVFPIILKQANIPIGGTYSESTLIIIMCKLLLLNISLILIKCLDHNVERSFIGIAPYTYEENYLNACKSRELFISSFLKGIIDSLIVFYGVNYTINRNLNIFGQTDNKLLAENIVNFSSYLIIYLKLVTLETSCINVPSIFVSLISITGILLFEFIDDDNFYATKEFFGYINLMFLMILIIFVSYGFEFTLKCRIIIFNSSLYLNLKNKFLNMIECIFKLT